MVLQLVTVISEMGMGRVLGTQATRGRLIGLVAALSSGCSTATHLSAGPLLLPSPERGGPVGAEVLAKAAAGSSSARNLTAIEFVGRGLALGEAQALSVGAGPAWFGFWGRHSLLIDADVMLGIANIRQRAWALGSFRAALGSGIEIAQSETARPQRLWFGGLPEPTMAEILRQRTLVTVDFGPTLDVSEALSPVFSVGLRVGVAWVEQRYAVALPPRPSWPFGLRLMPAEPRPAPAE